MSSQMQIVSNLMIDDMEYKPHYKWMPGDLVAEIYKELPVREHAANPHVQHEGLSLTPRITKPWIL